MKVQFDSDYLSIKKFDSINLPDFVVLTGLNGAGKTHFLMAIDRGNIKVDSIDTKKIKYFSYLSFRASANTIGYSEIRTQRQQAWLFLVGQHGLPSSSWVSLSRQIYNTLPSQSNSRMTSYEEAIGERIFSNEKFMKSDYARGIIKVFQEVGKPLHEITENEFNAHFSPSTFNFLSTSLAAIFTNYKVKQRRTLSLGQHPLKI